MGFASPFNIFPGIFSTFDCMQKVFIREHLAEHNKLPEWFKEFGCSCALAETPSTLKFRGPATDILLVGIPDEVLVKKDKSLLLLDYKTAKHTKNQDSLFPIYEGQLNAYAWLLENLDHGKVSRSGLVYFEPTETRAGAEHECFEVAFKATEVWELQVSEGAVARCAP